VRKALLILAIAIPLLAVAAMADEGTGNSTIIILDNCTSEVNCSECSQECDFSNYTNITCPDCNCTQWQNVSFGLTLSPGENIKDKTIYNPQKVSLYYDVTCVSCNQEIADVCTIDQTIDPGEDYSRHTSMCDVDIECEACDEESIISQSCPDGNRTVEMPLIMQTRNQDRELVIHVGDTEVVHTIGKGIDYSSMIDVQCPKCEGYDIKGNLTYDQCRAHMSDLCFSEEAANFMVKELSGSVKLMATTNTGCEDNLAVARNERDSCVNDKSQRDLTIQSLQSENSALENNLTAISEQYRNATRNLNVCMDEDRCSSAKTALIFVSIIAFISSCAAIVFVIWVIRLKNVGGDI
jgi:hypothetical protein